MFPIFFCIPDKKLGLFDLSRRHIFLSIFAQKSGKMGQLFYNVSECSHLS